ncbi:HAMP domain-containing sensor histidine kinase [Ruminococcus sp.]|uniref:sensor histidine kinase n=1 Tax=Ruminococcus sp. TaxID=41978 RepID=UPI0025CE3CCF|nr:HAMP domain-containing sensor histidine kinase [Ruminococcus sp.]MBQ8967821.1 HAMP domain-containing histidine kinase [Ruminococcus sp.]
MTWLFALIAAAAVIFAFYERRRRKQLFSVTDMMLEQMLNREKISVSAIREGELSAVADKLMRLQERSEGELARTLEEKEQLNRRISDMSHQLKTPLSSVIMYSDLLQGEASPEKKAHFAERMKVQLDKLDWLLGSMFKMIGLEQNAIHIEPEYLPIRDTLLSAINSTYDKLEKKQMNVITLPFEDIKLLHDRKWTAEVFVNIIENAVKYSQQESTIEIAVRPYELFTEIEFRDSGMGIRAEELTEIFKRFYRSKDVENLEGSGIGLYLSRLILEQEKGSITVKSEYGKGSSFSVFLQNCQDL